MTSNINPNDIDGQYPVAGQDNNSQGFRDNFTNTKTNFQYAANEITDLQNKAVLKAALTGTTLDNNMNGSTISNVNLLAATGNVVPLGTLAGSVTLDFDQGSYQTLTTNGAVSIGFANLPSAGVVGSITLQVDIVNTSHTITFPTAVSVNTTGIQGLNTSTNVLTVAATGTYSFTFSTSNGGSTINIAEVNKEIQPFNNSSELIAANATVSLAATSSVITSSSNLVLVLPAGVAGQTKVVAYGNSSTGNALVTVVNAGWKASGNGTANLHTTGSAATFQYVDSKWFCIGNNGCTFS
jgi:hypothetical protein